MRIFSTVATRIYALFVFDSTSVPGLGAGEGEWWMKLVLAIPVFSFHLLHQPFPNNGLFCFYTTRNFLSSQQTTVL